MTTPRVTENPIAMARVEPDSFIDDLAGPTRQPGARAGQARPGTSATSSAATASMPAARPSSA
jgi:hypothetical protein